MHTELQTPMNKFKPSSSDVSTHRQLCVSIVLPCLNEEGSLPLVLNQIKELKSGAFHERKIEVILADNGSTDNSISIAEEFGVTVHHCSKKGYGAALQCGICKASNDIVVYADADGTYDFRETPKLVAKIEEGYDLVVGSRLKGKLEKGAMPFLHRYLGTPALNFFINLFYGSQKFRISDCNSGFRAFRRKLFKDWDVQSSGMEFASEMLVKALVSNIKIAEVPIGLFLSPKNRTPHLKTWRDGMRHLLQIMSEAPHFFNNFGLVLWIVSWAIILVSFLVPEPIVVGLVSVFAIHTMLFALLGTFLGLTLWGIGLFLTARKAPRVAIYRFIFNLSEDKLFWVSSIFLLVSISLVMLILFNWASHGFVFLSLVKETVALSALIMNGILLVSHMITAHMIKRT
jgi:glycosyltransferase involved in cell wall biosynthesis